MAGSIQFRGINNVLEAFQNRDVEAWSIYQGSQFLFKGMGVGDFETVLKSLLKGNNVIYTVKVYEEITDLKQIKSKTPDDGSFNFRLYETDDNYEGNTYYQERRNGMSEKLKELEEKNNLLQQRLDQIEESEEEISIGAVMNNPKLLDPYLETFERILGITNKFSQRQLPSSIGNVNQQQVYRPQPQQPMTTATHEQQQPLKDFTEEEYKKLGNALYRIYQKQPDIVNIIETIANRIDSGENMDLGKLVSISPAKLKAVQAFL